MLQVLQVYQVGAIYFASSLDLIETFYEFSWSFHETCNGLDTLREEVNYAQRRRISFFSR